MSHYRHTLPGELTRFSSEAGRAIFAEALGAGTMEGYFALAEQHHTQAEPAFCGLGSLVMVLNALAIDPGRTWRGPWRWFSEDLLDCCRSLDQVKKQGITLAEFACLARCNGANADLVRPEQSSMSQFRADIRRAATAQDEPHMVVSFDRGALGQSGEGHFSPIAGFHEPRDLALVLDVARFKYPPYWVPVERLWSALWPVDAVTGRSRGYAMLTRGAGLTPILCNLAVTDAVTNEALAEFLSDPRANGAVSPLKELFAQFAPTPLQAHTKATPWNESSLLQELNEQIRAAPLFARVAAQTPSPLSPEVATLLVLGAPPALLARLPADDRTEVQAYRARPDVPGLLRSEMQAVEAQLGALIEYLRDT